MHIDLGYTMRIEKKNCERPCPHALRIHYSAFGHTLTALFQLWTPHSFYSKSGFTCPCGDRTYAKILLKPTEMPPHSWTPTTFRLWVSHRPIKGHIPATGFVYQLPFILVYQFFSISFVSFFYQFCQLFLPAWSSSNAYQLANQLFSTSVFCQLCLTACYADWSTYFVCLLVYQLVLPSLSTSSCSAIFVYQLVLPSLSTSLFGHLCLPACSAQFVYQLVPPSLSTSLFRQLCLPACSAIFVYQVVLPSLSTSLFCHLCLPAWSAIFVYQLGLPSLSTSLLCRLCLPACSASCDRLSSAYHHLTLPGS